MDSRNIENKHNIENKYDTLSDLEKAKQEQESILFIERIIPTMHHVYLNQLHQNDYVDDAMIVSDEMHVSTKKRPVPIISIQGKKPNRLTHLEIAFSQAFKDIYHSLWITFSFDKINFAQLKNSLPPLILAGFSYNIGEYISAQLSQILTGTHDFDFIFKFMASSAILAYSAKQRITEEKFSTLDKFSVAAASELLAIAYLYSASFKGSSILLDTMLPSSYSLLLSLTAAGLLIPGGIAYYAQMHQKKTLDKQYKQGAQRSDTTLIASGLTPVGNTFFQANRLLLTEVSTLARGFQLGLISNNIINDMGIMRQLRNFPAMVIDIFPQILRKLFIQLKNADEDFGKNTAKLFVLQRKVNPPQLVEVKAHQIRTGDLIWCGKNFDFSRAPISGEVHAFDRDQSDNFILEAKKPYEYTVNLSSYTGETIKIKNKTGESKLDDLKEIDQRAIQEHKQLGILNGAEIDFFGEHEAFFIRAGRKKEMLLDRSYEKRAVINQIINQYKQQNIVYAMAASISLAGYMGGPPNTIFLNSLRLLLSVFQMIIPFSEAFLREMVNSKMMNELNRILSDFPMEMIDALRIVDLNNVLSGYYQDKFPKGAIILSDKTGTLTTTKMAALGLWTNGMDVNVQSSLNSDSYKNPIFPDDLAKRSNCFEAFACAYTNSNPKSEPEEYALLKLFKRLFKDKDCLKVEEMRSNHFKKTLKAPGLNKSVETMHLGLYPALGGRLTLCSEGGKKSLLFCGIPKADKFRNSQLLDSYLTMKTRMGVLSRDWCVARTNISNALFTALATSFATNNKEDIAQNINHETLESFTYVCTFLIDNPVKKGVEKFIPQCRNINVPVIVATGDTAKASQNIARVLCADRADEIITIRAIEEKLAETQENYPAHSTVIFTGVSEQILNKFDQLIVLDKNTRPNIIFSEMTTKDKGALASHLKKNNYFVIANGDGTNDIAMMQVADVVIAHLLDEGTYQTGVGQYANINDRQVEKLQHSKESFYELFDIHLGENSRFFLPFIRLANAQEMVSHALGFKTIKMSFELAKAVGALNVKEVWQQQLLSILFDLCWLWTSFKKINEHADLPVDKHHLGVSWLPTKAMLATVGVAALESWFCYQVLGSSTDITLMIATLGLLPTFLTSYFLGYQKVQDEMQPLDEKEQIIYEAKAEKKSETTDNRFGRITSLYRNPLAFLAPKSVHEIKDLPQRHMCVIL